MESSKHRRTARFACVGLLALVVVPIALGATPVGNVHAGGTTMRPASTEATPSLDSLVLRGTTGRSGYVLKRRPDGVGVRGFVTLDMCGFDFRSESLRTGRLQVNYSRQGSPEILSNEVVSYRPGGAGQAMREVERSIRQCPSGPVPSEIKGVPR